MIVPQIDGKPTPIANNHAAGRAVLPDVHLITIVDLLAEAFVAKLTAANDNRAPSGE